MTRNVGGPPTSPILVRAVELTEDGEWHDYEEIIQELSKLVPPGRALRRNENERLRNGGPPERYMKFDQQRLINSGKRALAREFLKKTWFETNPKGWVLEPGVTRQIRLVKIPTRLIRDRRLAEAKRLIQPAVLIPLLIKGESFEALKDLDAVELRRLVKALVERITTSEARWLEW